ncbi:MAG: hypothetical protein WC544_04465 [Patescibacteria group bacterium]
MEHSIGGHTLDEIYDAVHFAVGAFLTHRKNDDQTRKGGYCSVIDRINEEVITTFEVGNPAHGKAERYRQLSVEKALRLLETNEQFGHVTSWQSRDEQADKWGGAIIIGDFILSFSGFSPDLADEAVMIRAAHRLGWLNADEAESFANMNDNEWTRLLMAA